MRRTLGLLAVMLAVSLACEDPTGILGPLGFGIESGREQAVVATETELPEPVVARVVRDASTGQALLLGASALYAQEDVTGVQGAVVCVGEVPIEGDPIIPHARCTNTQADGRATFHLTHPKKAGQHKTPIVAEVDGEALTPDTVTAIVEPGPASVHPFHGEVRTGNTADLYPAESVADAYGNAVPWMFASDCACLELTGDFDSWPASRTLDAVSEGAGMLYVLLSPTDTLAAGVVDAYEVEAGIVRATITFP